MIQKLFDLCDLSNLKHFFKNCVIILSADRYSIFSCFSKAKPWWGYEDVFFPVIGHVVDSPCSSFHSTVYLSSLGLMFQQVSNGRLTFSCVRPIFRRCLI